MVGSRMFTYKQGSTIKGLTMRSTFIPSPVQKGPRDELIRIAEVTDIDPDENGDFLVSTEKTKLFKSPENRLHFDAVHTFAVCRQVLTMYERAFSRLNILKEEEKNEKGQFDFKKMWGKPLNLYIRAFDKLEAVYTPEHNSIYFGYADDVFTCRSIDIVAHETGHAVFNAIKRGYRITPSLESWALEESFCDLTNVFALLSQPDICEIIIARSKGDLCPAPNCLFNSNIAGRNGIKKNKMFAIRDVSVKHSYDETIARSNCNGFDLSLVFSSAVYNFLVEIFKDQIRLQKHVPADTLLRLSKMVSEITIGAFYQALADRKYGFKSVGLKMVHLLKDIEMDLNHYDGLVKKERWSFKLLKIFLEYGVF